MKLTTFLSGIKESAIFAFQNLRDNPLRTFLSLLGITIGIFCISAILTLVDSLNYNIKQSLSKLGDNVIYIQRWPWTDFGDNWWKYVNRPEVGWREMQMLSKRYDKARAIAFHAGIGGKTIKSNEQVAEGISVRAISKDYPKVSEMNFAEGRFFSAPELTSGSSVIVLGHNVAENLFPFRSPIGKKVRALEREMTVIGVLKKEGESAIGFGGSVDDQAFIPVNLARKFYPLDGSNTNTFIMVTGPEGQTLSELENDLRGIMRSIRNIRPKEEDNFALNKVSLLTDRIDQVLGVANIAGWIVAAFSILVGGFGVANIMFVSVKERTPIIGIQKAIGAPRSFILVQFLVESIILCIIGGLVGIVAVGLISLAINNFINFQVVVTASNVLTGLALSTFIGLTAGFIPAFQAAQMDPIKAIRYAM